MSYIRAISEQIEAANLEVAKGRKLLLKEEIGRPGFPGDQAGK